MHNKILFVLPLPPPVHGSSLVSDFIKKSTLINNCFNTQYINLSTSMKINEIGQNFMKKPYRYLKILCKLIFTLIKFKPDFVYISITAKGIGFYKDFPIAMLVKLFRKKLVLHYHNKGVFFKQNNFFDNILYKILFDNTKIILLSELLFKDVSKYVKIKDVFFCPNGIPEVNIINKSILKKNQVPQILFLSNLIESKGVFILLEALKILKTSNVNFKCNFVGVAGDISTEQLCFKIRSLNLDNEVSYLGAKFGQHKTSIFRESDIFVHPTYNDCFPLVLLEASQFSLPLISTIEGAIPEIINDGINGFLIPKNNAKELADKLSILIKDENTRKKFGLEAYKKYLNEFTLNKFEKNFITILKSLNFN